MCISPPRHLPVLCEEAVASLAPKKGGLYVDATFGGGGYARAILDAEATTVFGLDRDPDAVTRGRELEAENSRFSTLESSFRELSVRLEEQGVTQIDGLVADLGVSSFQLDDAGRGFSFRADGPLDMRMAKSGQTAADLVNELPENDLASIIFELGEEPRARHIARAIARQRSEQPILSTGELQALVARVKGPGKPGRDPATQTFQALRMAVNDELGELDALLRQSLSLLRPSGRLVVVSFHSLEDRRVKRFVDAEGGSRPQPSRHLPLAAKDPVRMRWVQRKVIKASTAEVERNPRSRSAKLRVAERVAEESDEASGPSTWELAA